MSGAARGGDESTPATGPPQQGGKLRATLVFPTRTPTHREGRSPARGHAAAGLRGAGFCADDRHAAASSTRVCSPSEEEETAGPARGSGPLVQQVFKSPVRLVTSTDAGTPSDPRAPVGRVGARTGHLCPRLGLTRPGRRFSQLCRDTGTPPPCLSRPVPSPPGAPSRAHSSVSPGEGEPGTSLPSPRHLLGAGSQAGLSSLADGTPPTEDTTPESHAGTSHAGTETTQFDLEV